MHMLIAFIVVSLVTFFPVFWVNGLANSFDAPGRTSGWVVLMQSAGIALGIGLVAALLVGGIWAILAPLFGG